MMSEKQKVLLFRAFVKILENDANNWHSLCNINLLNMILFSKGFSVKL